MRKFLKDADDFAEKILGWIIAIPLLLNIILIPITIFAGCLWLLFKIFGG